MFVVKLDWGIFEIAFHYGEYFVLLKDTITFYNLSILEGAQAMVEECDYLRSRNYLWNQSYFQALQLDP